MEENLVGYLLQALDPETQSRVEAYLRDHAEARHHLELLRQALDPLGADRLEIEPPPGLAARTVARVARQGGRQLPRAPRPLQRLVPEWAPRRWRRTDVLVAASLMLVALLLSFPGISLLRNYQKRIACANNLRVFGQALIAFSDKNDTRAFPDVSRAFDGLSDQVDPPSHRDSRHLAAGLVVPMLVEGGVLSPEGASIDCPAHGSQKPLPWTREQLKSMPVADFRHQAPELAPGYAYTLGYWKNGEIQGYRREDGILPIMADSPPFTGEEPRICQGNSPNHGCGGQNVLFTDGHVDFLTERMIHGDDIFTNKDNEVAAGKNLSDHVLGPSGAHP